MTWCTGLARLCPRGQTARLDSVGKGAGDDSTSCPRAATRLCPPYDSTHTTASHDGSRGSADLSTLASKSASETFPTPMGHLVVLVISGASGAPGLCMGEGREATRWRQGALTRR